MKIQFHITDENILAKQRYSRAVGQIWPILQKFALHNVTFMKDLIDYIPRLHYKNINN